MVAIYIVRCCVNMSVYVFVFVLRYNVLPDSDGVARVFTTAARRRAPAEELVVRYSVIYTLSVLILYLVLL